MAENKFLSETGLRKLIERIKNYNDESLDDANAYTDQKIANLLNNSTEAVDSIMELAAAMEANADAVEALTGIAAGKADAEHTHAISEVTNLQTTINTLQSEIDANESSISSAQTKLATIEEGAQKNVKPDWNENDPNADGYVKNRPFYIEGYTETTFIDETTIELSENEDGIFVPDPMVEFEAGQTYNVIWNGTSYTCVALSIEENGISLAFVGNAAMLGGADTGEPFIIAVLAAEGVGMAVDLTGASTCTFSVTSTSEIIKKIDVKYLPDEVATKSDVFGFGNITWDGDTTGLQYISLGDDAGIVYKVSDYIPSAYDVIGQTITVQTGDVPMSVTVTQELLSFMPEGGTPIMYSIADVIVVFLEDMEIDGTTISSGTYFLSAPAIGIYISGLTIPQAGGHSHPLLEDAISSNVKRIDELEREISSHTDINNNPHNVTAKQVGAYTKAEVDSEISSIHSAIDSKATKATALSGYGITDAYTKSEVDSALSGKADVSDIPTVPTKVSAFENDAKYLTTVPSEYVTETELSAKGYATTTYVDTAEADANEYTDNAIANLLNNDTAAVDSIIELAAAMEDNADAIDALRDIAGTKAAASDLNAHTGNESNPHSVTAAQVGAYTKAEVDSALNSYMSKENPTGTGALSLNRKSGTDIGTYSTTEGYNNTASGNYSHAEGYMTTASNMASHAEGRNTTASGNYSHAEGYATMAYGSHSHAEGSETTASGTYSHAEGYATTASGTYSHAEGNGTIASGNSSHAEGQGTTASGSSQHVHGKYNIQDTNSAYVHIVGNGTADDARSNAHTLDWNGNAWYKGAIRVGGTSYTDAEEVATKSDIDSIESEVDSKVSIINSAIDGKAAKATTLSGYGITNAYTKSDVDSALNKYMKNDAPTGIGELSLNRKEGTAVGAYSVAEGQNAEASGFASHAEGQETIASGYISHAEGRKTTASGEYSHAEGHSTTASGMYSHAEGRNTTASGNYSHTEGNYTLASSNYQHVQGKYNIEDAADTYAHIVGNGSASARSNAHTLDWDGNAWYAGTIKVGGTSYNDASEVALKSDVIQSDWNENNPSSPAYIVNRPFYTGDPILSLLTGNITITLDDSNGMGVAQNKFSLTLEENKDYVVTWNGTDYNTTCVVLSGLPAIGNGSILGMGADTGEPFLIGASGGSSMVYATSTGSATVSVKRNDAEVHKINPKYIDMPKGASIGMAGSDTGAEIFNNYQNNTASGEYSHAEGNHTTASGDLSHAEGSYTTASGKWSHAEGYHTTASADYSHAEGYYTSAASEAQHVQGQFNIEDAAKTYLHIVGNGEDGTHRSNAHTLDWDGNAWYKGTIKVGGDSYGFADEVALKKNIVGYRGSGVGSTVLNSPDNIASGRLSYAEGDGTQATGEVSHAEGYETQATEEASHAEGYETQANGSYSHAEGCMTQANGRGSHAEGSMTQANGRDSHAEGLYTIASSDKQHVQGKYNIEDTSDTYAHIVGNGIATNVRSNAHTLDWDGNAWYAGTIKVGGTSYADASDVATKAYIEELLGVIENGSY